MRNGGAFEIATLLEANSTICELFLIGNDIHDAGMISIAKSLCTNKSLRVLDVNYNSDEGILEMLESNHTLTKLNTMQHNQKIDEAINRNKEIYADIRFKTTKLAKH